jgi:hypothetical protein
MMRMNLINHISTSTRQYIRLAHQHIKQLFLQLLLAFAVAGAHAQTPALTKEMANIKNNNECYWGEGTGKTTELADKSALAMLINSISVHVKSTFEETTTQEETKREN